MASDLFKGLWEGYADKNRMAPYAKNQPWYYYRNFRGPTTTIIPEPVKRPQVYNRWVSDPYTKAFLRWCNRWLFCNKKIRAFVCVSTAFLLEKELNYFLYGLVRYNNMECTMEFAFRKEKEWRDAIEAEKARRRALGLPEEDEEEWEEEEEEDDE